MTGYGRGEAVFSERSITVELRSVNNRYLDCTIKMPRAFLFAEEKLKNAVQVAVARGKVDVFISVDASAGDKGSKVTVNEALCDQYYMALTALRDRYQLRDDITVSLLSRMPDVLTVEKAEEDSDTAAEQLLSVLALALEDYTAMREREGAKLVEDILSRADTIEALTKRVEELSPKTVADYRARLEAKMSETLANTQIDESRILTEAAIFADKVAVDEETVRLKSHLSQLRDLLNKGGSVGRKLDFLIQEFNREANTIGSKCSDIEIARIVVDIKAEIEKIREQVQNIE